MATNLSKNTKNNKTISASSFSFNLTSSRVLPVTVELVSSAYVSAEGCLNCLTSTHCNQEIITVFSAMSLTGTTTCVARPKVILMCVELQPGEEKK